MVGSVALGRFGHSVTSLGDLNNLIEISISCDGQHLPVVMDVCPMVDCTTDIMLLVLHLCLHEGGKPE